MAADSDAVGSKGLLSLPVELMEAVTSELPSEDLLSLRLVCKDTESKVLGSFTSRCFSEKSFLLGSSWSMDALERISQHPQFNKSMTRITIDLRQIISGGGDERMKRKAHTDKSGKLHLDREERIEYRELRKTHQALQTEHRQFVDSLKWAPILYSSLKNFSHRTSGGLALTISGWGRNLAGAPCGLARLQRTLGYEECLQNFDVPHRHERRILQCIVASGCTVKELIMPDRWSITVDTFAVLVSSPTGPARNLTSTLHKVDLALNVRHNFTVAGSDGLRAILTTSPYLKVFRLYISCWGIQGTNTFWDVFMSKLFLPSVQQADLNIPFSSRRELIEFIRTHRKTLQLLKVDVSQSLPSMKTLHEEVQQLKTHADAESLDLQIHNSNG